jgi:NAD(P)-dependent dehydrogenase (short-subunit alcohol dehydrogenase family)
VQAGPKTWFITGCSSGFGRVLAQEALQRGDRVALTARDTESLVSLVEQYPERARAWRLDVCDVAAIHATVTDVERAFGPIDIAVNNAGFVVLGAIEEIDAADYRRLFDTNFFGALETTRAVLPFMRARRAGAIVNISALGGLVANAGLGYYCATKHALEAMSEALAEEVAPLGIRVLVVEPGQFRTAAMAKRHEASPMDDYAALLTPLRQRFAALDGHQPGDPVRAAQAIFAALDADPPAFRLPLGKDALTRIRAKIARLTTDMDRWEATALSTDYPS